MPPDKRSLPPAVEENARLVRSALKRELAKQKHRRGEIAEEIGRSESCLYKFTGGQSSMQLERLLHTLHAMGLDAGRFLAGALGAGVSSAALLEGLEDLGQVNARMRQLETVAKKLESSPPEPAPAPAGDVVKLLAKVMACGGREQRRRIGKAERYRSAAFASAYLEYLDAQRYDDPKQAASSAAAVATHLIPRLGGAQEERLALMAEALGVFGSAHRGLGNIATAARAVRVALEVARRHKLRLTMARLLQRGAYVLGDDGQSAQSLKLLDEALLIYLDLDEQLNFGMVVVDRGIMHHYLGEYRDAVRCLKRGLAIVQKEPECLTRTLLGAYQTLALSYDKLGQLDRAEEACARAAEAFDGRSDFNWAKLVWLQGHFALRRRSFVAADELLRRARTVLDRTPTPDAAVLCLDLTKALLGQERRAEAAELAKKMASYLSAFSASRVVTGAIMEFVRLALKGELSVRDVDDLQRQLRAFPKGPTRGLGKHRQPDPKEG